MASSLTKQQVQRTLPKDTYPIVAKAMDQGFIAHKGSKHIKLKSPDGDNMVTVSKTPSDYRDIKNLQSTLIKAGVDLTPTKQGAVKKKAAVKKSSGKTMVTKKRATPLAVSPKPTDTTTDAPIHVDEDEDIYNATEIIELIIEGYKGDEIFTCKEVHEALIDSAFKVKTTKMGNVREKVSRMIEQGKVKRVGRGKYQRIITEEKEETPKVQPEPTNDEVLDALKETPVKVDVEVENTPVATAMERINKIFETLRDEMKEIDTLDSRVWYEFFVMLSARERLVMALAATEVNTGEF